MTINGQDYTGNVPTNVQPASSDSSSIIRTVSTYFPIKGATNVGLTCGANSTAVSLVANANPGDSLAFSWKAYDLTNWFHNAGPMLTYMANCGSTTCDQYDITNAKWFKIEQVGLNPNGSGWAQAGLNTGGVATATVPPTLASGNYMLRHEIIALQNGGSPGGAEFYPACAQIKVGGSQTGAPTASELVSLPGAYSDTDPGILDPDVYNPGATYTFPGPPIASFVAATTNGTSSGGNSTGNSTTTAGTATTTAGSVPPSQSSVPPTTSGKSCRVTVTKSSTTASSTVAVSSRHLSRVMRQLAFGEIRH